MIVVDVGPVTTADGYRYEQRLWIDAQRRIAVRRDVAVLSSESDSHPLQARLTGSDYREIAPGIWLPMRVNKSSERWEEEAKQPVQLEQIDVEEWQVNAEIPRERFEQPFPKEVTVQQAPTPAPAPALASPAPAIPAEPTH